MIDVLTEICNRIWRTGYGEQAGFRAGRSTTEQIVCEKYLKHQQNLYHVFVDFKKKTLTENGTQSYGPPCEGTLSVQI